MTTASDLLTQAAELAQRAATLAGEGCLEEAAAAQKESEQVMRRAKRALTTATGKRKVASNWSQTDREMVVNALGELEVPASPKLVGDYALARFGVQLKPSAFASIRRDERRAWGSPRSTRAVYLAPALDASRLTPLRGLVTLSDWELHRRLIGPRSARVDFLRAARSVAKHVSWIQDRGGSLEALGHLMAQLARPLQLADTPSSWAVPDPADVVAAAEAELELLEEADTRFRTEAAERALRQLDDEQRLWGAKPLGALPNARGA